VDSYVRARNGARAGGPRVAFFLGGAVGSRHAHARAGLGNEQWSKKRTHAAAVRCALRWYPVPPPRVL
jgi:hypothetical protein